MVGRRCGTDQKGEDGQGCNPGMIAVCKDDSSRWVPASSCGIGDLSLVCHGEFPVNIITPVPHFTMSSWPITLLVQKYHVVHKSFHHSESSEEVHVLVAFKGRGFASLYKSLNVFCGFPSFHEEGD